MVSRIKQALQFIVLPMLLASMLFLVQLSPACANERGNLPNVFTYVESRDSLDSSLSNRLELYKADPTAAEIQVVQMNIGALMQDLRQADGLNLNLPNGQDVALDTIRI